MSTYRPPLSLRLFLLIVFIAGCLCGIPLLFFKSEIKREKNFIEHTFEEIQTVAVKELQRELEINRREILALSTHPVLQQNKREDMILLLNHFVTNHPQFELVMLVNLKGQVMALNTVSPRGNELDTILLTQKNYADEEWFQNALFLQKANDMVVEAPRIDPMIKEMFAQETLTQSFSITLKNKRNDNIGILTLRWNLLGMEKALENAYSLGEKLGRHRHQLTIVDDQGIVLAKASGANWIQREGEMLQKSTQFPAPYLYKLNFEIPRNEVYQSITAKEKNIQRMTLLLLIISFTVCFIFLATPLRKLKKILPAFYQKISEFEKNILLLSKTQKKASLLAEKKNSLLKETDLSFKKTSEFFQKQYQTAVLAINESLQNLELFEQGNRGLQENIEWIEEIMQRKDEAIQRLRSNHIQQRNFEHVVEKMHKKLHEMNETFFQNKLLSVSASMKAAQGATEEKSLEILAQELGRITSITLNQSQEMDELFREVHELAQTLTYEESFEERASEELQMLKKNQETIYLINEIFEKGRNLDHHLSNMAYLIQEQLRELNQSANKLNSIELLAKEQQEKIHFIFDLIQKFTEYSLNFSQVTYVFKEYINPSRQEETTLIEEDSDSSLLVDCHE